MSMMWIKKQAPWVIGIFGVLIVAGLIMMDRAGSYRENRHHNVVGKVAGEEIATDRFQMELRNYLKSEEVRTGKAPEGLQLALMREGFFNFKVQDVLMKKLFREYQLFASVEEMQDYLARHPQEVARYIQQYGNIESIPPFLTDSTFNPSSYANWLDQDSIYDRVSMQDLEVQLKNAVIPQIQLKLLLKSQVHATLLEEAAAVITRENKARLRFYFVSADSFPVAPEKFREPDLKVYFEAHPDSFYFRQDAARLGYLKIPLNPSHEDSSLMFNFAKELKERAKGGETFSDLAKNYSNDSISAEKGGKLEGLRSRESLDPSVAAAAWALNPGDISDPVLGPTGYHILLAHERKMEDSVEKMELSDILLKITTGTMTIDSLMESAEKIRSVAQKEGLEKAASQFSFPFAKTPIFEKDNMAPLGGENYVPGLNSFAFSQFEAKDKISEGIQTNDDIYILERDAKFPKGRNFERAKSRITEILVREEKENSARKELESQKASIQAAGDTLPPRVGKAVLDSTVSGPVPGDSYLPGFGSNPVLFKALNQPQGVWGSVLSSERGAILVKITEKISPSEADIWQKAEAQFSPNASAVDILFQDWVNNLPKSVKVENKMDMVFRN